MSSDFQRYFSDHAAVVESSTVVLEAASTAANDALVAALAAGHKVITFGNGGSSAEASHLAEELVGRFKKTRRPYPAMSLSADSSTVTCISNDFGYEALFERQIEAFVQPGDVAIALTTSGKSENVLRALRAAKLKGGVTVALTGAAGLSGGEADHVIAVPSRDSALIQEIHLMLIHIWCQAVESALGAE